LSSLPSNLAAAFEAKNMRTLLGGYRLRFLLVLETLSSVM
jgi:hypothetical protein